MKEEKSATILSAMLTEISIAVVIVFVCLSLHVAGLLFIAEWLLQHRQHFERPHARIHFSMLMVILFSGIMLLHVAETTIWAAFYYSRELFRTSKPLFIFRW